MAVGFAQRVWDAYKDLEKREGRVSQGELARRIQAQGGHPTRQDDVSRWFREVSRPELEELPAIATVLGVDLMRLAFGDEIAEKWAGGLLGAPPEPKHPPTRPIPKHRVPPPAKQGERKDGTKK